MGVPAETRSILGHLFNISMPYSYENPVFELACGGIEELNEDFSPESDTIQYICEDVSTSIIKSYEISFSVDLRYIKDSKMQNFANDLFRRMPVGGDCAFDYIRFNKDETIFGQSNQFIGIRRKATICPGSIGGSAGDPLNNTLNITGSGSGEIGIVTVTTVDGHSTFSWAATSVPAPYISKIGSKSMNDYYRGITIPITSGDTTVTFEGVGVPGDTIAYIKDGGSSGTTTATVSSSGTFSLAVTLTDLATDSDANYVVAFKQSKDSASSVTTSSFAFKTSTT